MLCVYMIVHVYYTHACIYMANMIHTTCTFVHTLYMYMYMFIMCVFLYYGGVGSSSSKQ